LGALKLKRDAKSTLRPTHTKHPWQSTQKKTDDTTT
jgi:hypothetical protein